jgi:hypothetical protein
MAYKGSRGAYRISQWATIFSLLTASPCIYSSEDDHIKLFLSIVECCVSFVFIRWYLFRIWSQSHRWMDLRPCAMPPQWPCSSSHSNIHAPALSGEIANVGLVPFAAVLPRPPQHR